MRAAMRCERRCGVNPEMARRCDAKSWRCAFSLRKSSAMRSHDAKTTSDAMLRCRPLSLYLFSADLHKKKGDSLYQLFQSYFRKLCFCVGAEIFWPCYSGHLGPSGPKWPKESEMSPGAERPRGSKKSRTESKTSPNRLFLNYFDSFSTPFWTFCWSAANGGLRDGGLSKSEEI